MGIKRGEVEIKRHYFWSLEIVIGLLVELRFVSFYFTELRCFSGRGSFTMPLCFFYCMVLLPGYGLAAPLFPTMVNKPFCAELSG